MQHDDVRRRWCHVSPMLDITTGTLSSPLSPTELQRPSAPLPATPSTEPRPVACIWRHTTTGWPAHSSRAWRHRPCWRFHQHQQQQRQKTAVAITSRSFALAVLVQFTGSMAILADNGRHHCPTRPRPSPRPSPSPPPPSSSQHRHNNNNCNSDYCNRSISAVGGGHVMQDTTTQTATEVARTQTHPCLQQQG